MKHYVAVQLRSRLTKMTAALQTVRKSPTDIHALHDFRVATRRFLQAIRLFSDFLDRKRVRAMRGRLHRLMESCGAVRNHDVTLELLKDAGITDPALELELLSQRQQLQEEIEARFKRWQGDRSPKHWRKWLRPGLPAGLSWNQDHSAAENAHAVLPVMATALFDAGKAATESGADHDLHRFRLLGKRFRYSLELFPDVYEPELERHLKQLRGLQDRLGAINDCAVALEFLKHHPDAEQLVQALLETRRREFFTFWKTLAKQSRTWEAWLGGAHRDRDLRLQTR